MWRMEGWSRVGRDEAGWMGEGKGCDMVGRVEGCSRVGREEVGWMGEGKGWDMVGRVEQGWKGGGRVDGRGKGM